MNMTRFVTVCCLLLAGLSLVGCRIALLAVEGGDISSASGRYYCSEGRNCIVEITAADFSDTFTALPAEGYEFVRWRPGPDFLCGDVTSASCDVDNRGFAGNAAVEGVIATDYMYYLLPEFGPVQQEPPQDNLVPVVIVAPIYPRRAQTRGIEGFCELEFTVTETGTVAVDPGPQVVNCSPEGVFDSASIKAVLKFKYEPVVVDGQPTAVPGVRYTVTFELE